MVIKSVIWLYAKSPHKLNECGKFISLHFFRNHFLKALAICSSREFEDWRFFKWILDVRRRRVRDCSKGKCNSLVSSISSYWPINTHLKKLQRFPLVCDRRRFPPACDYRWMCCGENLLQAGMGEIRGGNSNMNLYPLRKKGFEYKSESFDGKMIRIRLWIFQDKIRFAFESFFESMNFLEGA